MTTGEFEGAGKTTGVDEPSKVDQAKEKVTDFAAKARETATSEEVAPAAKKSGATAAVIGVAAAAVWLWRRRVRRNRTLRNRVTSTAKVRGKAARGQVKKQAKVAAKQATAAGKAAKKRAGR